MFLFKNSFFLRNPSIFSLLLFPVLLTQSVRININYLDVLTVSVHEWVKCLTIEKNFTFFFMGDLKRESQGFHILDDLIPWLSHVVQYAKYVIFDVVHVRYLIIFLLLLLLLLLGNIQKMIHSQKIFYRSYILSHNHCNQDHHLFLLMIFRSW